MHVKVFAFFLILALAIIAARRIVSSASKPRRPSLASGPPSAFLPTIFVAISAATAASGASRAVAIITSAGRPKQVVVGVVQEPPQGQGGRSVADEIRLLGHQDALPNVRVCVSEEANLYERYALALSTLRSDEEFFAVVSKNTVLPEGWDVTALAAYEATRPSPGHGPRPPPHVVLSASPRGDFTVCAGELHGVPFFEARELAFQTGAEYAIPLSAVFPEFVFTAAALAPLLYRRREPGDSEVPEWAIDAVVSSATYDAGVRDIASLRALRPTKANPATVRPQLAYEREEYSRNRLRERVSDGYRAFLGWDFEAQSPIAQARLGVTRFASDLEMRVKWGDEAAQDYATSVASGSASTRVS